ncbi:MAG: ATP-binding protein, partial [Acidimicrobiia bacterium]
MATLAEFVQMSVAGSGSHRSVESSFDPGAFPAPLTSFIGRTECCTEVAKLLDRHRLVTLTGSGGCGKTRLALEVATDVVSRFGDQGVFVDLSPVESNALVVNSVAAACRVSETGTAPLPELLLRALAEQRLLVLLDNCEHVADECAPLVHQFLSRCASVAVLATSREPLGVDGEVTYRVPPLTVPDDSGDSDAALRRSEAGQLFLDRAGLARPDYFFSQRDAAAAVGVCRRLDGVPLAIELAASRLRVLDAPALAEALTDHFDVLGEGPRTAPPRHRTLEASMDWSHELLDDRERRVFRRLGVFAGSFSGESAAAVCAGPDVPGGDVFLVLTALVDRSLVQLQDSPDGTRYRLLEAVRDYARSRLVESGETEALRDHHLDHHVAIAETFAREPGYGSATDAALERIAVTLDDMRTAMDWSIRSGQVEKGLRAAAGLRAFWVGRNRTAEGRAHLAGLLDADTGRDVRTRASALVIAAQLADYAADPTSARDLATEALELSRASGDRA